MTAPRVPAGAAANMGSNPAPRKTVPKIGTQRYAGTLSDLPVGELQPRQPRIKPAARHHCGHSGGFTGSRRNGGSVPGSVTKR